MITSMDEALKVLRLMNKKETSDFIYYLELEGWYREDKRQTKSFCKNVIIFNWNYDKPAILRALYRAVEHTYLYI